MGVGAVVVRLPQGMAAESEARFFSSFTVGRSRECDLTIKEPTISRRHCRVESDGSGWRVRDLGSGNGTYLDGERITEAPLPDSAVLELGQGGPLLSLTIERPAVPAAPPEPPGPGELSPPLHDSLQHDTGQPPPSPRPDISSETQIIRHYFDKADSGGAGEQTMMFRRAFDRAHRKKSKKYWYLIGVAVVLLAVAGTVIFCQKRKLEKMRGTAENIFYLMKTQELQIVRLEEVVLLNADPKQVAELRARREKFTGLEKEYDSFVRELGIYGKLTEEEKIIMRMARLFGECEVAMPPGFAEEVKRYIGIWRSTNRLQSALARAREKGYTPIILRVLKDNNLPTQYFFLALQESGFNEQAVGPPTRYGHAKGIWQFITQTADRYGLRVGPLYDQGVYDPLDERFNFVKSTVAAMRYIRELNSTYAQASGLLVMASYNWGEGNVREIISRMPDNPRERNFWRLLALRNVPKETYDYVFSIFSAAVICENPQLFGFDGSCPGQ